MPTIPLLSAKKFLVIANISEHEIDHKAYEKNKYYQALVGKFGNDRVIPICAKIEFELSQLDEQDAQEMMNFLGITEKGLDRIIQRSYAELDLITFFTCGPKEIHAWTVKKGTSGAQSCR